MYVCITCGVSTRALNAAQITRDTSAAVHRSNEPAHTVIMVDGTVSGIMQPDTGGTCPVCENNIAACDASGCAGRKHPGWRASDDIPPF